MDVGKMERYIEQMQKSRVDGKVLLRRRTEDVNYWRQRAGWFDDDASMKEYNSGIYDAYYQPGDDDSYRGGGSGIMSNVTSGSHSEAVKNTVKVLAVLVSVALMVLLCRVISRRYGESTKNSHHHKKKSKKTSEHHQRSPSRSRSRSRSRKTEGYDLMDDDDDGRSRKSNRSSRSKSKRKKSRSRSRPRSRSRSRSEQRKATAAPEADPIVEKKEAVLV